MEQPLHIIEMTVDRDGFRYGNRPVWPLIKLMVHTARKQGASGGVVSGATKIKFMLSGMALLLKVLLLPTSKKRVALLSSAHFKAVEGGKVKDRIIDPFISYLDANGNDYVVFDFVSNYRINTQVNFSSRIISAQAIFVGLMPLWRLQFKLYGKKIRLEGDYEALNEQLQKYDIAPVKKPAMAWRIFLMNKQVKVFKKLLRKYEVEHVMIACYYDSKSLALTRACNELGISSTDLQHGTQSPLHSAYGQWTEPYASESHYLPSSFWVWDRSSENTMRPWNKNKKVFVGGNRWILDRVQSAKRTKILVTLQPIANPIPQGLIDAIRDYEGPYKWALRLHPQQLSSMEYFNELLNKEGIAEKVDLESATKALLTDLLAETRLHLTAYSSVAIEAAYFEVPTLFLDPEGLYTYQLTVSADKLFLVEESETVLAAIARVISTFDQGIVNTGEAEEKVLVSLEEYFAFYGVNPD